MGLYSCAFTAISACPSAYISEPTPPLITHFSELRTRGSARSASSIFIPEALHSRVRSPTFSLPLPCWFCICLVYVAQFVAHTREAYVCLLFSWCWWSPRTLIYIHSHSLCACRWWNPRSPVCFILLFLGQQRLLFVAFYTFMTPNPIRI